MRLAAVFGAVAFLTTGTFSTSVSAHPTTYVFVQTSSNFPGIYVDASYTLVEGTVFPSADSEDPPYDFGGLLALDVSTNGNANQPFSLSDLVAPCEDDADPTCGYIGLPVWSLDPTYVLFVDKFDSYDFEIVSLTGASAITASTDAPSDCYNHCMFEGFWSALVPATEPSTATLFVLLGLLPIFAKRRAGALYSRTL